MYFKLDLDIPSDDNKLISFIILQDLATRYCFHIFSYMVKSSFSYFLLDDKQICLINEARSCSNTLFNTLLIFPHNQVSFKVWSIPLKSSIIQYTRFSISNRINLCFGSICIYFQWGFLAGLWILIKVYSTTSLYSCSSQKLSWNSYFKFAWIFPSKDAIKILLKYANTFLGMLAKGNLVTITKPV